MCLWNIVGAFESIWRCVQVELMKALWWWIYLPHCFFNGDGRFMENNKQVKGQQTTMLLLKDLARRGDTPPWGKDHSENDGTTTICLNMMKNDPVWQCWKVIWDGVKQLGIMWKNYGQHLKLFTILNSKSQNQRWDNFFINSYVKTMKTKP